MSMQNFIPVRTLDAGILVTDDFRLVQLLRISSFNLDLMSHRELNETIEKYEMFLRSISFPIQTTIMSQPVDLGSYVKELRKKLDCTSSVQQKLLQGYIAYAKGIETSTTMIQRQRFLILQEQIIGTTKQAYEESMILLDQKKKQVKNGLEEIGLQVQEANDVEAARYLHTLFDYNSSLHRPMEDVQMYPYTMGARLHEVYKE